MKILPFLLCMLSFGLSLYAQNQASNSPIIFIYDASGSMWGQMQDKTKMEIAADVLSTSVNNLPDYQQIGLVAYGHRRKDNCEDVEFLVDVESGTKTQINQSLNDIKPLGKTPLAYSAIQVIDLLRKSKMKATIILVTDGIESCRGNICDVIRAAKEEGIDFRLHIIGFGLQGEETEQLKCATSAGDGQYYEAADAGGLSEVLNAATSATIDKPVGNFTVFAVKNGKPIDAYVKARKSGTQTDIAFARTYGDTSLFYLPPGTYDLEVTPLENSDVNAILVPDVESFEEKVMHQTVSFDGGKIQVNVFNNDQGWDATVKVYSPDDKRSVASGRTYGKPDVYEVNPGVYDIEIKALVIEGLETTHFLESVAVKANETTEVEHVFDTGIAMIGANSDDGLVDAVINIKETDNQQNVANGRSYTTANQNPKKFILNPGTYEVILKALGAHQGKTETFTLTVKKGETIEKITNF